MFSDQSFGMDLESNIKRFQRGNFWRYLQPTKSG